MPKKLDCRLKINKSKKTCINKKKSDKLRKSTKKLTKSRKSTKLRKSTKSKKSTKSTKTTKSTKKSRKPRKSTKSTKKSRKPKKSTKSRKSTKKTNKVYYKISPILYDKNKKVDNDVIKKNLNEIIKWYKKSTMLYDNMKIESKNINDLYFIVGIDVINNDYKLNNKEKKEIIDNIKYVISSPVHNSLLKNKYTVKTKKINIMK